jgi:hypothetical protein
VEPPGDLSVGQPVGESGRDALAVLLGQPSSWHDASIAFAAIHCNAALHSSPASLHQFVAMHLGKRVSAIDSYSECNVAFELCKTRTIAR